MASANEFGASVWKQANSWLEIGKKKFMEVHDAVADQQWPGARGSWARPEQRTEYTSSPSQRFRDYGASSSSDDDDDRYVSANRRGRQPVQHVEAPTRASPRLHTEPEAVRDSRSRRADAADLLGGMTGGLGIAREAPVPPAKPQHLRPQPTQQAAAKAAVPAVPGNALAACNAAKATANEQFKLGQFGAAVAGYTQAMAQVTSHSEQHPLLILLLNNRALAYTRNGEAKMALADCSQALALCAVYQANGTIELGGAGRVDVADQRAKALQRRAEAHEAGERYQEALADWKELREAARDGRVRQQAVHGVQRCERALGGGGSQPAKARAAAAAAPATADDIASVFASISMASIKGGGTNILNRQTESSAAVAEMRRKEQERLAEDDLRLALTDQVDADLTRWKAGKQHNLRALLSSVHTVLPAFPPIGMHEVLEAAKVKRAYMRTIARLHPDKLDKAADVRTRMVSANVFSALNEAWDAFKAQESM
ncbi:auxilin-like clathrin-binding protein required for normal clathrin function [Coemansia nantahalensis]|nr:auxilin-like clathrin-binding protein required for normal clathrin function [Coemansia nantahalensis]